MIKYFLKITATPTEKNPYKHIIRTEYYGNRVEPIGRFLEPIDSDLKLYGFNSISSVENAKNKKEEIFKRDDTKFNNWVHTVEIIERDIT